MNGHQESQDEMAFLERVMRFQDGSMGAEEIADLEREIMAQAAKRRLFAQIQLRCASLRERFRLEAYGAVLPGARVRQWPWLRWPALVAAAALVVLGMWLGQLGVLPRHPTGSPAAAESAAAIATLLFGGDCQWHGKEPIREGQRLLPGPLKLAHGLAVFRFDNGAEVALTGPADLELASRSSAFLREGRLTVRAGGEAAGFTLRTPASEVTDLGTEFAVKVEKGGATEIHVLEGSVSYRKPGTGRDAGPEGELLGAGKAIRYDTPDRPTPREVELRATGFEETLRTVSQEQSPATLLAQESFDYPAEVVPLGEANGGFGWQGPWQPARTWPVPEDPDRPLHLDPSSVIARGRLLDASNGFPQISRKFAAPIRMDRDGVFYFSVRVRWLPGSGPAKHMRQVRVVLRSASNPKHGRYTLNLPACLCPQIQRHDLEVFTSREKVVAGDLQRWALKIVAREHGEDELHFRVFQEDEPAGSMEPETWHLSLTHERSDAVLDQIVLDTYLSPDPAWFGDIRFGTNWRAVVSAQKLQTRSDE